MAQKQRLIARSLWLQLMKEKKVHMSCLKSSGVQPASLWRSGDFNSQCTLTEGCLREARRLHTTALIVLTKDLENLWTGAYIEKMGPYGSIYNDQLLILCKREGRGMTLVWF